jgi:hypothetical protein
MAVTTDTRQTGLIAKVIDNNLNAWEDFAGLDINIPATYEPIDATDGDWDIAHWSYRGQASMCQLANGDIVRVRLGDWTNTAERRIQRQIITDPTDPSQWQTWSWLAYDDNYSVAVERDDAAGAGYRIYHGKSNGIYMDNVLLTAGGAAGLKVVKIKPVYGQTNMIYFKGISEHPEGDRRYVYWAYLYDTVGHPTDITYDAGNYFQYHQDLVGIKSPRDSDLYWRFRATPNESMAPNEYASDILTLERVHASEGTLDSNEIFNIIENVEYLKGPSARAGFKRIDNLNAVFMADADYPDGTYYLYYTEQHLDQHGNVLSNLKSPLFFSRAPTEPGFMSEAMPIGYSVWGFAGVVEADGYLYLAGNGRVLRRPLAATEIDITDYVIEGRYGLPRDNGTGRGVLTVANPNNIIGAQLGLGSASEQGLTDREVQFGLGVKRVDGVGYTFKRDARWWISSLRKVRSGGKDNIEIELGDFWHRMSNPFRDTWRIPGHFTWSDWQPDAVNQLYNYTNAHDETTIYNPDGAEEDTVPRLRAVSSDQALGPDSSGTITLFTGLPPSVNIYVSARFWANAGGIVFRYQDEGNYFLAYGNSGGIYLYNVYDGDTVAELDSTNTPLEIGDVLSVYAQFGRIVVALNDVEVLDFTVYDWTSSLGFVGVYAPTLIEISNLLIEDFNWPINTQHLIKLLLAYVDEHTVEFEEDEETLAAPQLDVLWGPQSDLDSPEKALRAVLETSKLNVVWRQD